MQNQLNFILEIIFFFNKDDKNKQKNSIASFLKSTGKLNTCKQTKNNKLACNKKKVKQINSVGNCNISCMQTKRTIKLPQLNFSSENKANRIDVSKKPGKRNCLTSSKQTELTSESKYLHEN